LVLLFLLLFFTFILLDTGSLSSPGMIKGSGPSAASSPCSRGYTAAAAVIDFTFKKTVPPVGPVKLGNRTPNRYSSIGVKGALSPARWEEGLLPGAVSKDGKAGNGVF
jgi:hypothetical protein